MADEFDKRGPGRYVGGEVGGGGPEQLKEQLQFVLQEVEGLRKTVSDLVRASASGKRGVIPDHGAPVDVGKIIENVASTITSGMQSVLESQRKADKENFERLVALSNLGDAGDDGEAEREAEREARREERQAERENRLFQSIAELVGGYMNGKPAPKLVPGSGGGGGGLRG